MDKIHKNENRRGIGKRLHLKTYFEEFAKKVEPHSKVTKTTDQKKMVEMVAGGKDSNLTEEKLAEIQRKCSLDNFTVESECPIMKPCLDHNELPKVCSTVIRKFEYAPFSEESSQKLKTLKFLANATEEETQKRLLNLRQFNHVWFESAPKPPIKLNSININKQIVVHVRIYRPWKNTPKQFTASYRYVQEIVLLGKNRLTDLRDFIKCPVDYVIPEDASGNPDHLAVHPETKQEQKTWENQKCNKFVYRSGFIYIDGCFYNDTRWPSCIDYSETIRAWASNPKRQMGPFETAIMEDTLIEDLTVRMGYPYVYVHQGDHEHLISFVDAHLMSNEDVQQASKYPYERSTGFHHSKYCNVCNNRVAKWVTVQNSRVPEDPYFFCENCFKEFNFDKNGKKRCDFKAYNYVESNAL